MSKFAESYRQDERTAVDKKTGNSSTGWIVKALGRFGQKSTQCGLTERLRVDGKETIEKIGREGG